jgi:myo-inositol-1(or 4)-monophosphatase
MIFMPRMSCASPRTARLAVRGGGFPPQAVRRNTNAIVQEPPLSHALDRRLETATRLATEAGRLALSLAPPPGAATARMKGHQDWLTEADGAVEAFLKRELTAAFPEDGFQGEETGTGPAGTLTWIVDPIDGTSNFTAGLPYWCTAVGLALDGAPVLGIIDAPVLGRRYVASIGEGAHLERRTTSLDGTTDSHRRSRLHVRGAVDWRRGGHGHVPVMLTTGTVRRVRDVGLQLNPRVMGSTALDLAMVAEGVAAASVAVIPKVWDIAAGMVLVREAGGVALEFGDQPLFPVRAGEEHRARSTPFVAGPDERYVRDLAAAFLGSP